MRVVRGASLRGRFPPPAALASQGRVWNKVRMNEAGREVHDFYAQADDSQMPRAPLLQENNQDAACMHHANSKDGEREQCCTLLRL